MGHKTTRPNGQRYHAREVSLKVIPDSQDVLLLGTMDESVIAEAAKKAGIDISAATAVEYGWWTLGRAGVRRKWQHDEDAGEPGAYLRFKAAAKTA